MRQPKTKKELEGPPIPYELIDKLLDRATPLVVRRLATINRKAARKAAWRMLTDGKETNKKDSQNG